MKQTGYVYFLINKSFPSLIKVGYTIRSLEKRVNELRTTGVPTPFIVGASFWVDTPEEVERSLHNELKSFRVEDDREFFSIDLESSLQRCMKIILPALSVQGDILVIEAEPPTLEDVQIWLLEFALSDDNDDPYYSIIDQVSHDYEVRKQIVLLNADRLVNMKLLKCVRDKYKLTPEGRALCFEDDRIYTDHVTDPMF